MQQIGATDIRLTPGERALALAYLLVMALAACLSGLIVLRLGQGRFPMQVHWAYWIWICLSGGIGGVAGLHLVRGRLGHPGLAGALRAVSGMMILCLAASLIAGTLALPLYGTMFGPFLLAVTLVASPLLAFAWFTTLAAAHLMMRRWRAERDSIFAVRATGAAPQGAVSPRRGSSGLP